MARHVTDEQIAFAANGLKDKLKIIWSRLKSESNNLADCIPLHRLNSKFMPTEAGLCLLICSMFPDDHKIPIEELAIYGMGLELFEDVDDMFAARYRVNGIISRINDQKYPRGTKAIGGKTRLAREKDGPHDQYVKVLDGARDLAKSIASRYPLVFHRGVIMEKWPESNQYTDCCGLSLVLKKVNKYPVNLKCPSLTLLLLQYREDSQSIPVDFFEGMNELRVLSLDVPSLPRSLNVLRNLRMLRLKASKFEDMSLIKGLINLEFLSISVLNSTDIPREMGLLENLRLLDLRKMNIAYIPPGVLSRMAKLEELYFPLSFKSWGCKPKQFDDYDNSDDEDSTSWITSEIDDGGRINASLTEIASLSLNALEISVPNASILPKKSPIFKNIREFKILVPNNFKYQPFGQDSRNKLQLTGEACDIKESGIFDLMSRTEDLSLIKVRNLTNVSLQIEDNGFSQLKQMIISECHELEYVVDTTEKPILSVGDCFFSKLECLHLSMLSSLKEIQHERWSTFRCFPNLSHISIRFCHKLKYILPLSAAVGSKLKSIEILDCNEIEGIFYEDEDKIRIPLGSVEKLHLHSLPRLISLLIHKGNTSDEVHHDTYESLATNEGLIVTSDGNYEPFPTMKSTPLNQNCYDVKEFICAPPTSTRRGELQKSVTQQLISHKQDKDVIGQMKMHCAFPPKLARWSWNFKELKISFCDVVQVVFLFEENDATFQAFNSLKELELHGLRNLVHVWFHIPAKMNAFQNLHLLVLSECCNLYLFSSRVAKLLVQLQKIYISRCEKMEEIVVLDDENEVIVFPQLKLLEFQRMPNLRIFFSGIYEIELPLLESLKLNECNKMKSFSYGSLRTPMLEKIEINGRLYSLTGDLNATIMGCEANLHCQSFSFADLKIATWNFGCYDLSSGMAFSTVYKGWIDEETFAPSKTRTGMPVSINRLSLESMQEIIEGQLQLNILEKLSHPNLVKCIGYCWADRYLFLVYEFMERGNLDKHLFTFNIPGYSLSWHWRIKIAIGAARGLDFLHTQMNVIHRNIKPSVIMLYGNYNAKISGFELVRPELVRPSDGDSHVTTTVVGTFGYTDPEYIATGHCSIKSDVYSFGVVLLELMTGLRAIDPTRPKVQQNLVDWSKSILSQKRMLINIMDAMIEGQYSSKAMSLAAQLSLKCLESEAKRRPSMKEVVDSLEQIKAIEKKQAGR